MNTVKEEIPAGCTKRLAQKAVRTIITVGVSYGATVFSLFVWPGSPAHDEGQGGSAPFVTAIMIGVIGFLFAVLPVFGLAGDWRKMHAEGRGALASVALMMWMAVPLLLHGILTSFLPLILSAIHLLFVPGKSRTWQLVQYGTTSFTLTLLIVFNHTFPFREHPLPFIYLAALQIMLLGLMEHFAWPLWLSRDRKWNRA